MTKFQKVVCAILIFGIAVGGAGFIILNRTVKNLPVKNYSENKPTPFSEVKYELREPDANTFRVMLAVTAYPQEYTKDSTAQLVSRGQAVSLELSAGVFTGEMSIPLEDGVGYKVSLEDDGLIRSYSAVTELLYRFASGAEVFDCYPKIKTENEGASIRYQMDAVLKLDETLLPFDEQAVSARVYMQNAAGEELFSEKMSNNALQLEQEVLLAADESITIYGEVLGKSGMTYIYSLHRVWRENGDNVEDDLYPDDKLRFVGTQGQELLLTYS